MGNSDTKYPDPKDVRNTEDKVTKRTKTSDKEGQRKLLKE